MTVLIARPRSCFLLSSTPRFRDSPVHVVSGIAVGLTVVAGWAVTGLAYDDMATRPVPPISLTYIRPMGDTLQWLALFTASPAPGFGVASVFGALAGRLRSRHGDGALSPFDLLRRRRHACAI